MSDNPFRELPKTNPYATPSGRTYQHAPSNPLLVPAIVLLVLSASFLMVLIASMPGQIMRLRSIDTSTPEGAGELVGGIVALFVWTAMTIAIIAGSICMLRLKGYSGALTAAIISVIPVCSPCFVLGIPFGIWAIVLLRKPEVKNRFR